MYKAVQLLLDFATKTLRSPPRPPKIVGFRPVHRHALKDSPARHPAAARNRPRRTSASDFALKDLWVRIRMEYFPAQTELDDYTIYWVERIQLRVLGTCNYERRVVRISRALDHPELVRQLEALIHHEMCHAALGKPPRKNGRRVIHGHEFRALENTHPDKAFLDDWIKSGGWSSAVRSYRMRRYWQRPRRRS
jgi:hypothetical protein